MRKKLIPLLLALVLLVSSLAPLAACEKTLPPHAHSYENGICTVCNEPCPHEHYENGECAACHTPCLHEHYENGVCATCRTPCAHTYKARACTVCGQPIRADYSYTPHEPGVLPRILIATEDGKNDWATVYFPEFDNNNPENNIDWQYNACSVSVAGGTDEENFENAKAEIKVRGNWTTTYPKKPFRIKFSKKQNLLGLNGGAACKNWVLLADYKDCSLSRNSVAFYLGKQILGSDGYYSSDFRQVELYLNGLYWGVYLLAEQQQVNENRIDISEPEKDDQRTDIGYLLEYDGYYNLEIRAERFYCDFVPRMKTKSGNEVEIYQHGFSIKNDVYYDDVEDCAQKKFIKNYMNKVFKLCYEAAYNRKYYAFNEKYTDLVPYSPQTDDPVYETVSRAVDVRSLADTYLLNEICCDYDLSWSSFYMDVDFGAGGDKILRFEAPWDFDSALGMRENACTSANGLFAAEQANPWLLVFVREDWFQAEVKAKWRELKANNVPEQTLALLKAMQTNYATAYQKNFARWGFVVNGECYGEAANVRNQKEASEQVSRWLTKRFAYLDSIWQ